MYFLCDDPENMTLHHTTVQTLPFEFGHDFILTTFQDKENLKATQSPELFLVRSQGLETLLSLITASMSGLILIELQCKQSVGGLLLSKTESSLYQAFRTGSCQPL